MASSSITSGSAGWNHIDTSNVITWQYNNALRFISLLEMREELANYVTEGCWDAYFQRVFNINTCDEFGLWMWAQLLGVNRPVGVSNDLFRNILKARTYLLFHNATVPSYLKYLNIALDAGNGSNHPEKVIRFSDNLDMTYTLYLGYAPTSEEIAFLANADAFPNPTGVKQNTGSVSRELYIGFDGQLSYAESSTGPFYKLSYAASNNPVVKWWGTNDADPVVVEAPDGPFFIQESSALSQVSLDTTNITESEWRYKDQSGNVVSLSTSLYDSIHRELTQIERTGSDVQFIGCFYFAIDGVRYILRKGKETGHLYYVDEDTDTKYPVSKDANGYYYQPGGAGTSKVYIVGQHLGVFDMTNFRRTT